ncbi:concanavalin A-like lectin/glucanase [Tanacetum coccineum]
MPSSRNGKGSNQDTPHQLLYFPSRVGGSMIGSGTESASLSFQSNTAYRGSAKTFSSSDMEKATDNFNELGVLGDGGSGRFIVGPLKMGLKLLSRNLVRLLGICTEERNRCLVYELIPNGSVESHLHGIDKEVAPLDWKARSKIALGAARGKKTCCMSIPSGKENLVAWARSLLPTPEGLNLLIDPSLFPEVPFDSIAKVAAIASMCVQPEVSHRPFMGEVVQALKLVCNECEETRDMGSRTGSQEDLTYLDFYPRVSTNSGHGPDPGPSHSTYPSYESPLDVENGFSSLGLDVHSYRITSSSGPLRPWRRLQIWEKHEEIFKW